MTCSYLTITTRDDGVIALDGEFDVGAARDVVDAMSAAGPSVDLDLTRVTFVDSAGLQTMLRFVQEPGNALRVIAASACVRRVFGLAGVAAMLSGTAWNSITECDEP